MCFWIFPLCIIRLRAETSEKQLEELVRRAIKLQGDRMAPEDFAQFLNLPVTDTLTDIHRLFDQVNTLAGLISFTVWKTNKAKWLILRESLILFTACRRTNRHQTLRHRPLYNLPTKVNGDAQTSLLGENVDHQIWHNYIQKGCSKGVRCFTDVWEGGGWRNSRDWPRCHLGNHAGSERSAAIVPVFISRRRHGKDHTWWDTVWFPKLFLFKHRHRFDEGMTDASPPFLDEFVRFVEQHPYFVQNYLDFKNHPRRHCFSRRHNCNKQSKKDEWRVKSRWQNRTSQRLHQLLLLDRSEDEDRVPRRTLLL